MRKKDKNGPAALKQALARKTRSRRHEYIDQVSLADVAAITEQHRNDLLPRLKVEFRAITGITAARHRIRRVNPEHVQRIARIIKRFGVVVPILIDRDGRIINGHIVVEAAKALGLLEIPCTPIEHLSPDEREALAIAINVVQEKGEFDIDVLNMQLRELDAKGIKIDNLGLSIPELDIVLKDRPGQDSAADHLPAVAPGPPVSRLGDLFHLGESRVLCADATLPASYERLLGPAIAQMIIGDQPFNIPIEGFVSPTGKHPNFVQGVGEWSREEFQTFTRSFIAAALTHVAQGALIELFIDWRSVDIVMAAGRELGLRHLTTAVWNKGNGGMGGLYRSAHEFIVIFVNGEKVAINNVALGAHGNNRSTIWTYPGANVPGSSANEALKIHSTPKSVALISDAILDATNPGGIILDPFLGSGTTIIAAEKAGRLGYGLELDPKYVDAIVRRWEAWSGGTAVHADSGLTFAELAAARQCEAANSDALETAGMTLEQGNEHD